jgi:hypothetical protein
MGSKSYLWLVGGVLCGWLAVLPVVQAWPFHPLNEQAPSSYSRFHYWAPTTSRVRACLHPADEYLYPAGFQTYRKGCPAPTAPSPYCEPVSPMAPQEAAPERPAPKPER